MVPKFHECFYPVLLKLSDAKPYRRNADEVQLFVKNWCKDSFLQTTEEELHEKLESDGSNVINGRIGWVFSYLKQAELIEKSDIKFHYNITQLGLEVLDKHKQAEAIKLSYIRNSTPFLQNRNTKERVKDDENTTSTEEVFNLKEFIEDIEATTKKAFIEYVRAMDWQYFEDFCVELLEKMGYGTGRFSKVKQGDGGIDGEIYGDKLELETIYIQAKRYSTNNVSPKDMKEFCYNVQPGKKGVFITTTDFSKEAKDVHDKHSQSSIALIGIDKLFALCCTYSHHIEKQKVEIFKPDFI
ncbi:MAG: restriction system protein [Candidatus Deianiraeaceae bacterium]|jgi:restriction system protein